MANQLELVCLFSFLWLGLLASTLNPIGPVQGFWLTEMNLYDPRPVFTLTNDNNYKQNSSSSMPSDKFNQSVGPKEANSNTEPGNSRTTATTKLGSSSSSDAAPMSASSQIQVSFWFQTRFIVSLRKWTFTIGEIGGERRFEGTSSYLMRAAWLGLIAERIIANQIEAPEFVVWPRGLLTEAR